MKKQLADLAYRRRELLTKIEAQRVEVTEISQRWQKPLALVDVGLKAANFIHNHLGLVTSGVGMLLVWRRKMAVGLVQEGGRFLYLYPATIAFGLKCLSLVARFSRERRNTELER
jgi:hypothetical protein